MHSVPLPLQQATTDPLFDCSLDILCILNVYWYMNEIVVYGVLLSGDFCFPDMRGISNKYTFLTFIYNFASVQNKRKKSSVRIILASLVVVEELWHTKLDLNKVSNQNITEIRPRLSEWENPRLKVFQLRLSKWQNFHDCLMWNKLPSCLTKCF